MFKRYVSIVGFYICLVFFANTQFAIAQGTNNEGTNDKSTTINLLDVLKSTLQHHPRIVQAYSQRQQAEAKQLQADAVFDWQIDQDSFVRTGGFFDGAILDQSLSRKLPFANAKISAGYRISDGEFPIYENINNTLAAGETYIKASVSLLRDREIDKNRAEIITAGLGIDIVAQQQNLILNDLLLDATLQYLDWRQASERKRIISRLVALAQARQKGIEQQVAAGELAQISLIEFQVTLLQRQAELLAIEQTLQKHAIGLSMFMRDQDGNPMLLPENAQANEKVDDALITLPQREAVYATLRNHPKLVALEREIDQVSADLRLQQNGLQPKLDASVLIANDFGGRGDRSQTLEGVESYISLDFSVPIGLRAAKGKVAQTKAKLVETKAKKKEVLDSIDIKLNQAFTALDNLRQLRDLREAQANIAERLMVEEQKRFDAGVSDLFLLNARETNFTRAQMLALNANIELLMQHFLILAGSATLHERVAL